MSIPKLTTDLAVIQKLSDLPNSTEGLTAAQLKAKFDEAPLAIQKWLNENLIPSLTAENIPFTATSEIDADNLADAIQDVHSQVRDASSGSIVNGSVTTAKLSPELLERVYGGRPWTGLDTPGSAQNPDTDFPIGQIWLRPAFTAVNAAGENWVTSGCTTAAGENRLTVTGNNTVQIATAMQSMANIGQDGDRVYVLFGIENKDSEISALTVSLNSGEEQDAAAGVFSGTLVGGALTVQFSATWPSTSLAGGSFDVVNYAVVNIDQIMRQTPGAAEMADWASYLTGLLPLTAHSSPEALYIQTGSGIWWPFGFDVLPLSRGGIGITGIASGHLLCGSANEQVETIKPTTDFAILSCENGVPAWVSDSRLTEQGFLRYKKETYTGTGDAHTIDLGVTPEELVIKNSSGTILATLHHGETVFKKYEERWTETDMLGNAHYYGCTWWSNVKLSGSMLTFSVSGASLGDLGDSWNFKDISVAKYLNEKDVTYSWFAMYI